MDCAHIHKNRKAEEEMASIPLSHPEFLEMAIITFLTNSHYTDKTNNAKLK